MFSVKLKVREDPRYNSLPRRRRATPSSSFSSSTSSLSRLTNNSEKLPTKSSFLSNRNGKNNKKVRIQTTYEQSPSNFNGRWTQTMYSWLRFSLHARSLNWIWHTFETQAVRRWLAAGFFWCACFEFHLKSASQAVVVWENARARSYGDDVTQYGISRA